MNPKDSFECIKLTSNAAELSTKWKVQAKKNRKTFNLYKWIMTLSEPMKTKMLNMLQRHCKSKQIKEGK